MTGASQRGGEIKTKAVQLEPSETFVFYLGSVFSVVMCPLRLTLIVSFVQELALELLNLKDSVSNKHRVKVATCITLM